MNATSALFPTLPMANAAGRIFVIVGMGACLTGCMTGVFNEARIDPRSPVAADVTRMTRTDRRYPRFTDIPPIPRDVRPAPEYGRQAAQVEQARTDLERATAPETWSLTGAETFAAKARRDAGPQAPAATTPDTEAFAAALRKRATPPPPARR